MGLSAKLNLAFVTVILAIVASQAGYLLAVDFFASRNDANKLVTPVLEAVNRELTSSPGALDTCKQLSAAIAADPGIAEAVGKKDREETAKLVKSLINRLGFAGYVSILEGNGIVFFSSDSPGKFGYQINELNRPAYGAAINGQPVPGFGTMGVTDTPCLFFMTPIRKGNSVLAVVSANWPIGAEAALGLQKKLELSKDKLRGFDLLVIDLHRPNNGILGKTPALNSISSTYVNALSQNGRGALKAETEADGRLWKSLVYSTPGSDPKSTQPVVGIIASAPLTNNIPKIMIVLGQVGIGAILGILLAFLFSAGISKRFNSSLQSMKRYLKDLASSKANPATLENLDGDWLELAEMMSTAVVSPKSNVQQLRVQLEELQDQLNEKAQQLEATNTQLESVNRKMLAQTKQNTDVSQKAAISTHHTQLTQQKLNTILQSAAEGFLILDQFGNVLTANPLIVKWTGIPEDELFGFYCFDLVQKPGSPRGSTSPHGSGDLIDEFFPEGVIYHRFENQQVEVLIHLQPILGADQAIQGYVLVLRDKSAHNELLRMKAEVTDMLANVIRLPLTASEPKWNALLNDKLEGVPPSVIQLTVELHQTFKQLLGVVDSYLLMYGGTVPVEVIPREKIAITRLIGDCLEQTSREARTQQIMLDYKTITGLPPTAINKEMARDIIIKILDKLITITAAGGRIRAESTVKGKEIRLIFSSSGPALSQEEIAELFIGFIEGKHAADSYRTRLDLYLAKNNMERLGGRMWAEADPAKGTAIFLSLPVQ